MKLTKIKKVKGFRSWLAEILVENKIGEFKQVYIFSVTPGKRVSHFHKKRKEWFCCIRGKIKIIYCDDKGEKEVIIDADKDEFTVVEIPPEVWHKVESLDEKRDVIVISGTSTLYDEKNPDTFKQQDCK